MAIGEEAWKSKAAASWLDDLAGKLTAKDVHLAITSASSITECGHANSRRRFVLPVLHHTVDARRADAFDEPLYVGSR